MDEATRFVILRAVIAAICTAGANAGGDEDAAETGLAQAAVILDDCGIVHPDCVSLYPYRA